MPGAKTISRAERLFRQRRFGEAISLLESQVFHHRDSPRFYEILGNACLRQGEFGGAHTYLTRARQLQPGNPRVDLTLALVLLYRREVSHALTIILDTLDGDPRNRRAKKLLSLIRSTEDYADFSALAEPRRLKRLLPSVGIFVPRWVFVVASVGVLAAAGIVLLPPLVSDFLDSRSAQRDGGDALRLSLPASVTDQDGSFRYELSPTEVEDLTDLIGELFNGFRDNLARREANRLLLSNASEIIKERVRLVASYFRVPTFVDFEDNFSFREVASEPWLYDGCHVRWNGRTSNIQTAADGSRFLLLVGYTDEQTLDGTVPVTVPFDARIEAGSIELIGRVEVDAGEISLVATSIRPIVPRNDS